MQKETNICFQYNAYSLSLIISIAFLAPDLSWVAYLGLCIFCILPIQTFTHGTRR